MGTAASKLKTGIVGASGYGGAELLKILLFHPDAEVVYASAGSADGRPVSDLHPWLRGQTDLRLSPHPGEEIPAEFDHLDVLFLAVPHGTSMDLLPRLPDHLRVVDLAGDYRLKDREVFEKFYKPHSDWARQEQFVYGLTEVYRDRIRATKYVANPGCFASAIQLALYPLVHQDLLEGPAIVNAVTGSSGSGATAKATTHHPVRATGFNAYKMFGHQHLPEVEQTLREAGPWRDKVIMQVHSAPMVRGIFATCYVRLQTALSVDEVGVVFSRDYQDCPFIRLQPGSPNVNWVRNTNFTDIGWAVQDRDLIVFSVIDNLVKGAAGQAVQNMNLMTGLAETAGLRLQGGHPL